MYSKVLLPVSGEARGERSRKALATAMAVSSGEIILLHVTEPISQVVGGEARTELEREESAQGLTLLCPIIEILENAGAAFHTRVEPGTIAETIVRIADEENADLIVMYTDGRDGLSDMLLGSITERVLRNTGVDLLAVRS
ncbi:MAG: universal stress protein [Desulfovibrio sp.]|nr:universal stress protein [Desulfovibrio sp.]